LHYRSSCTPGLVALVTVDDQRDVEPPLQPGGPVPQDHGVEPRVLLTHVPDLQRVVLVQPHPLQAELLALVHRLPVFVPGHTAGTLQLRSDVTFDLQRSLFSPLSFRCGEGRHVDVELEGLVSGRHLHHGAAPGAQADERLV